MFPRLHHYIYFWCYKLEYLIKCTSFNPKVVFIKQIIISISPITARICFAHPPYTLVQEVQCHCYLCKYFANWGMDGGEHMGRHENCCHSSMPNSTSTQVGSDKVISWTTKPPTTPVKLLSHFKATQEADFWYATLF